MDDNKKLTEVIKVIAEKEICGKQFRVWGTPEKPLFLAKDVAQWLGYKGKYAAKNMVEKVSPDEKVKCNVILQYGEGYRKNTAWFITESGLYSIVLESHLPQAKPIRKWVTHEVLPCIRKHGYYSKEQARLDRILKIANIVENDNYMIEGVR